MLTDKQKEVIKHLEGPLLVTAGPGSGKTTVLIERILYLLKKEQAGILSLTFSNKAAESIQNKIDNNVNFDEVNNLFIGTIHSFCLEVVMNRGNLIGLPPNMTIINNENDKIELMKKLIQEMPDLKIRNLDELKNILKKISKYKQEFKTPEMLNTSTSIEEEKFSKIYEAYNNLMLAQRALDFDDILFYAYKIFSERPKVARSYTRLYKYICVDEAQDLNETQYKVIKEMCKDSKNIMFVGDPQQSIYGFLGSNSEIMKYKFKNDFHPKEIELNENFRSTKAIVEATNKIQNNTENLSSYPLQGELSVHSLANEEEEAQWVVKKMKKLLKEGSEWVDKQINYEDIAVIARNRYALNYVVENLENENIPLNKGTHSIISESESLIIKVFETGLNLIINPHDDLKFNQILNLLDYRKELENVTWENTNYLEILLNLKSDLVTSIHSSDLKILLKAWKDIYVDEESFFSSLKFLEENLFNEKKITNENEKYLIQKDIEMWKDHWNKYCGQTTFGSRSLSHFRNQVSLGKTQNYDQKGVSALTIHQSKGLEFTLVFLMGLNEGTFPDYRAKTPNDIKDEYNNMFVALTRAKRICYITRPKQRMMPWGDKKEQLPSRFIKAIQKPNPNS